MKLLLFLALFVPGLFGQKLVPGFSGGGGGGGGVLAGTAVNCTAVTGSGALTINFAAAGPGVSACTDIVVTPTAAITSCVLSGWTSNRYSIRWDQGAVGYAITCNPGVELPWCTASSTALKSTLQSIDYDGTNPESAGCTSDDPTLISGDVTATAGLVSTVVKVNGIAYSATAAAHTVEVVTTANTTATAKVLPDCTDTGGNHLNFTQSTDLFSCGTSGGGATASAPFLWMNPFTTGLPDAARVVPQLSAGTAQMDMQVFTVPFSMTVDHIAFYEAGSGSNHYAWAIYDSACTTKIAQSEVKAFTGGTYNVASISASLVGGTTYHIALSSDSANGTDAVYSSNSSGAMGSILNSGSRNYFFHSPTSGTGSVAWAAGVATWPSICSTKTNVAANAYAWHFF